MVAVNLDCGLPFSQSALKKSGKESSQTVPGRQKGGRGLARKTARGRGGKMGIMQAKAGKGESSLLTQEPVEKDPKADDDLLELDPFIQEKLKAIEARKEVIYFK